MQRINDWIKEIYNVNVNAIFADNIHIFQKFNTNNEKKIIEMNNTLNYFNILLI